MNHAATSDPVLPALALSAMTVTSCLGAGLSATATALGQSQTGLRPCDFETVRLETYIGRVPAVESRPLPESFARYECRNHRLAWMALGEDGFIPAVLSARERYGADRVAVLLATSTSGMLETELAYREMSAHDHTLPSSLHYQYTHNFYALAAFVRDALTLRGPAAVVSTACSSSAKVFAMAQRMVAAGLVDAAVVGGVDSLCLTTLYGFNALQLTSTRACRPFAVDRDGISVGEAAAFVLLERIDGAPPALRLLGVGESSDAYHLSAPDPTGAGATAAMRSALQAARLEPRDIDYLNLHGTGTRTNDASEAVAVTRLFGSQVPCSSTKGATGHTLGAAGALEVIVSAIALQTGQLPAGLHADALDPQFELDYLRSNRRSNGRTAMSNSLGFGGTNASVIVQAAA